LILQSFNPRNAMTITLEHIEAKQTELADLIAKFKAQPAATGQHVQFAVDHQLQPGEVYAGVVLRGDGTPDYHLVLLPHKPDGDLAWQAAKDWAASVGGELPTLSELSLLYANHKARFEPNWYWSCVQHETTSSYAWSQYFTHGGQYGTRKGLELSARAVRRFAA
jgi:hypothetical protein